MPNLVLKLAKAGCTGCYYEHEARCPNQMDHKPWLKEDRSCQSELGEMIYVVEEVDECSS